MHNFATLLLNFLGSSNFKNIVSNSVRMHNKSSLISKCSQLFQLQIFPYSVRVHCPCFQHFLLSKTSFKMRKNAPFSVLSFKTFSAVPTLVHTRVCFLVGRFFFNMYKVKMFETVFSLNAKINYIFPCLQDIRLSYNI